MDEDRRRKREKASYEWNDFPRIAFMIPNFHYQNKRIYKQSKYGDWLSNDLIWDWTEIGYLLASWDIKSCTPTADHVSSLRDYLLNKLKTNRIKSSCV